MQEYFYEIADLIGTRLRGAEVHTCSFAAEASDFVRFNRSRVRQAGSVTQRELTIDLIEGRRHAAGRLALSGDLGMDRARATALLDELRARRTHLPEDPFLLYATEPRSTERQHPDRLPAADDAVRAIQRAGAGRDLVGIYAAGGTYAGFANSLGQRNWHANFSYNLDWSFYHEGDRAVKASYAGLAWQPAEFERKVDRAAAELEAVARPARAIPPGRYRVYLAPAALYELFELLGWGGFGLRAHHTKKTPLLKMVTEGARLHPTVGICENTAAGVAPDFESSGFLRPDRVALIEQGAFADCLVCPRSAAEFGGTTNGASAMEAPESVEMTAGDVPADRVLRELHSGIYVSNLWYLNYSDRSACRTTGLTRFATFRVDKGMIQEPIHVMRFDETLYRMLGENLFGLTAEREMILDPGTYFRRSTTSARLPGAIVDDFTFTS